MYRLSRSQRTAWIEMAMLNYFRPSVSVAVPEDRVYLNTTSAASTRLSQVAVPEDRVD